MTSAAYAAIVKLTRPSRQVLVAIPAFLIVALTLHLYVGRGYSDLVATAIGPGNDFWQGKNPTVLDTQNSSLGFQRVFVLSMPDRADKRDGISLGASLTGFNVEFIDGVNGETIPPKAVPNNWEPVQSAATLGCYRGHMDIAQKMLREDIQSALIFEDDADWDVFFKQQLLEFASGIKAIRGINDNLISPYGSDWDVLWFGHCGVVAQTKEDQHYYIISNDPTVAPDDHVYGVKPDRSAPALEGNNTRLMYRGGWGRCLTGYGLSLRGAQRVVGELSLKKAYTIDRGFSRMCSAGSLYCMATWPAIVGPYRAVGNMSKDSDRTITGSGFRKVAETRDIVYPMRTNLERFLYKHDTILPQWLQEGINLPELSKDTKLPKGRLAWVTKDQYAQETVN